MTSTSNRSVKVKDRVEVKDKNTTTKYWIGYLKRFFTVKVLPPRRD